jgi:hypothetical protein
MASFAIVSDSERTTERNKMLLNWGKKRKRMMFRARLQSQALLIRVVGSLAASHQLIR